jgi:hypothetical protein
MPHLSPEHSPLRGHGTVGEFDQVQGILDIGLELIDRYMGTYIVILELACQTAAQYRQGLAPDLFRQEEEFIEAESVTLEIIRIETVCEGIVPTVLVKGTVLDRSDGILPAVPGSEVCALDYAATGESEYSGMEIGQSLGKILPETVTMTLPSI